MAVERLHQAAESGDLDGLRAALEAGADVNASSEDVFAQSALHIAADHGQLEAVSFLLERGADPLAIGGADMLPLHMAVRNGHREVTLHLLEQAGPYTARQLRDVFTVATMTARGDDAIIRAIKTHIARADGLDFDKLRRELRDPRLDHRVEACHQLIVLVRSAIDIHEVFDTVLERLEDEAKRVRLIATQALAINAIGGYQVAESVQPLADRLFDEDAEVKRMAIGALKQLASQDVDIQEAVDELEILLRKQDEQLLAEQAALALGLGALRGNDITRTLDELAAMLEWDSADSRYAASRALFRNAHAGHDISPCLSALASVLDDEDGEVAQAALQALSSFARQGEEQRQEVVTLADSLKNGSAVQTLLRQQLEELED